MTKEILVIGQTEALEGDSTNTVRLREAGEQRAEALTEAGGSFRMIASMLETLMTVVCDVTYKKISLLLEREA
jgi:hypothetical protein